MLDWWQNIPLRRDKRTGAVLVRRPHSHQWINASTLYPPAECLVLDLVAGQREQEAKERRQERERGYKTQ